MCTSNKARHIGYQGMLCMATGIAMWYPGLPKPGPATPVRLA